MTYIKPQVLVSQEFINTPAVQDTELRAWIVGPNGILHYNGDNTIGNYQNILRDTEFVFPNAEAGSVIDKDSVVVHVNDALLEYAHIDYYVPTSQTDVTGGEVDNEIVAPKTFAWSVPGKPNYVVLNNFNVKTNGGNVRNVALGTRDVQIGDTIRFSVYKSNGTVGESPCAPYTFESKVINYGFLTDERGSFDATATPTTQTASTEAITPDSGNSSMPTLTLEGHYDPQLTGKTSLTYTISVSEINDTPSCQSVAFNIRTTGGADDADNVQPTLEGDVYTFPVTSDGNVTASYAKSATITSSTTWTFTLVGTYTPCTVTASGEFTGDEDDTYIITCVTGGKVASSSTSKCPTVTIRTENGLEFIGPIRLTNTTVSVAYGGTFTFSANDMLPGDKWEIGAESVADGAVCCLQIADSLPNDLRSTSDTYTDIVPFEVSLCVKRDTTIPGITVQDRKFTVPVGAQVTDEGFVALNGSLIPLKVLSGDMSVEYREWSRKLSGKLNVIASTAELDNIPGQLVPENPLKYAVYKALANSSGTPIVCTSVLGDDADDWQVAFNVASGSRDVYTVVPLSQDLSVLKQVEVLVNTDSNEETCAWKNCFLSVNPPTEKYLVGIKNSINKKNVLATVDDGVVEITSRLDYGQGKINTTLEGVQPGDEFHVLRDDGYDVYLIDTIEGDTITLLDAPEITTPMPIEIIHRMTTDEQVKYVTDIAGSFSNRRIKLVWPGEIAENDVVLPGTFLCAALAGLVSGSLVNQGLTRVSISGFDAISDAYTPTQLKELASNGVWVVMEDLDGSIYTMHGLTTNTAGLIYSEEMSSRIVDFISFQMRDLLEPYIGTSNVTRETIEEIGRSVELYMKDVSKSNYSAMGPLVTEYEVIEVAEDDLLKDRINVVLSIVVVKTTNNIELRIQAS